MKNKNHFAHYATEPRQQKRQQPIKPKYFLASAVSHVSKTNDKSGQKARQNLNKVDDNFMNYSNLDKDSL